MIRRASTWMQQHVWVPWTVAFVGVLYGGLAPLLPFYDAVRPVVVMQGEVVSREADSVIVHIWGKKQRECRYIMLQSFSHADNGMRHDTLITRIDMPSEGKTKPLGSYDIGNWRVRPVTGASAVSIYAQHECDARVVLTKIAEVQL